MSAAADTLVMTGRELAHWRRRPGSLLVGLLFPVLTVLMFGYLFGGAMRLPGGGDYREFLLPGMFAVTMLFGLEATMTAVGQDADKGVTDRFRSLPMHAAAVVAGRSLADMLYAAVGLAVMLATGLAVGWRWHSGPGRAAMAIGLLLLLRFALVWAGVHLGLLAKGPESLMAVQILVWPLSFLSSASTDPATMPGWLGFLPAWNPLSATVTATRALFGNPGPAGDAWPVAHALELAVLWPLVLLAVFVPLAVRRWRGLSR